MFHVKHLKVLLVNPYIYDVSAYGFWSSPLGLLYMGSVLRKNNMEIQLIDCLREVEEKRKEDGRAPFIKEKVEKPASLKNIKKRFRRYGISKEQLAKELSSLEEQDLILLTSIMTYWYIGTKEVLELLRKTFPHSKIVVGGIYPTLCYEHASIHMNKADLIVKNNEMGKFYAFIEKNFSAPLPFKPSMYDFKELPYPCFDLYKNIPFIPILTSYGCMYRCTYCATPYMHPNIVRRDPEGVMNEILHWHNRGVDRYALYDDNFLYRKDTYAKPLLRGIAQLPFSVDIYNPNAINAALIDEELANLLLDAGFKEARIGLESIDPSVQRSTGKKVDLKNFEHALRCLSGAGFNMDRIGVYILAGLPFQRWEDVKKTIDYLSGFGVRIHIAEYTPIPHTPMFQGFQAFARYPIADDPIYQNNVLFPFAWDGFTENDLFFLKHYAREKGSARQETV